LVSYAILALWALTTSQYWVPAVRVCWDMAASYVPLPAAYCAPVDTIRLPGALILSVYIAAQKFVAPATPTDMVFTVTVVDGV
jgi:hypothetical protein